MATVVAAREIHKFDRQNVKLVGAEIKPADFAVLN